jgi:hypothetical protein
MMELNLVDPNSCRYYNPKQTLVVAFTDPEIWAEVVVFYFHFTHVFNIYRDPIKLLLMLVDIASFFKFLDSDSYFAAEDKTIADLASADETALFIVYGLREYLHFEYPCIINGAKTLPEMILCFFDHRRSQRR